MTEAEFQQWFGYHGAAFPSLHSWLARQQKTAGSYAKQTETEYVDPLDAWFRAWEDVEITDARAATDAMAGGDLDCPAWSQHPPLIRRWVRERTETAYSQRQTRRIIDGEETFACSDCRDSGWVLVLDPRSQSARTARACKVICSCRAGDLEDAKRRQHGRTPVLRYDPRAMFRLEDNLMLDPVAFAQWAEQRQPSGYVEDFAEWDEAAF